MTVSEFASSGFDHLKSSRKNSVGNLPILRVLDLLCSTEVSDDYMFNFASPVRARDYPALRKPIFGNCLPPRRDVPVGVPLDLSTPTGMSCIGTYGENCKSDNVSKYRVLLVAFLLLWHEN